MKRSALTVFCALIFYGSVYQGLAQNSLQRLDSIYLQYKEEPTDTNVLSDFNSAISRVYISHPDTSIFYARQQVELAREYGFHHYVGRGYNAWGVSMEIKGEPDSAISLYKLAMDIGERYDQDRLLTDVYNNLGIVYSYKGLFESSLEYTLKALAIAEERRDSSRQAMIYNNIGLRYGELGQPDKAIAYYRKALAINSKLEKFTSQTSNYNNLGLAYLSKKVSDSAETYYRRALDLATIHRNLPQRIDAALGLATIYLHEENLEQAEAFQDSAFRWSKDGGSDYGLAYSKFLAGLINEVKGNDQEAVGQLQEALAWFEEARYLNIQMDIMLSLARAYYGTGNFEQAYQKMRDFAFAKDSSYLKEKDLAMEQVAIFKEAREAREKELLNQEILLGKKDAKQARTERNAFIAIGILFLLLIIGLTHRYFYEKRTKLALSRKNEVIAREKQRSDDLLLNILPSEIAEELKEKGKADAREIDTVTILFTDFKGFTKTASSLTADVLVDEINTCFENFDHIVEKYNIEKIKTIGDAYMAAGGLPLPSEKSLKNTVLAALEMQSFISERKAQNEAEGRPAFEMRVGIHTGPVVAGIVGVKKFQYDVWGDTVNTASRMESAGATGRVNISKVTYQKLRHDPEFVFESRGKIKVKGKGEMDMWFVSRANS